MGLLWEEEARRLVFQIAFWFCFISSTSLFGFFSGVRTTPTSCKVTFLKVELKDFFGGYHEIYSGSEEIDIASVNAVNEISILGYGRTWDEENYQAIRVTFSGDMKMTGSVSNIGNGQAYRTSSDNDDLATTSFSGATHLRVASSGSTIDPNEQIVSIPRGDAPRASLENYGITAPNESDGEYQWESSFGTRIVDFRADTFNIPSKILIRFDVTNALEFVLNTESSGGFAVAYEPGISMAIY